MTRLARMVATLILAGMCAVTARAEPRNDSHTASARPEVKGVVNLNSATPEELGFLPGIGPGKAHAIVERRHDHPFKKVEDVTHVKGIGRKTFGKLKPYLTLQGPTTLKSELKAPK